MAQLFQVPNISSLCYVLLDVFSKANKVAIFSPYYKELSLFKMNLLTFFPDITTIIVPSLDPIAISDNEIEKRIYAIERWFSLKRAVLLGDASAIAFSFYRKVKSNDSALLIKVNESLCMSVLLDWLKGNGYSFSRFVFKVGEFSKRGGIIDLFTPNLDYPVRIEFDEDLVSDIRLFNPQTQRSIKKLSEISIFPLGKEQVEMLSPSDVFKGAVKIFYNADTIMSVAKEIVYCADGNEKMNVESFDSIYHFINEGDYFFVSKKRNSEDVVSKNILQLQSFKGDVKRFVSAVSYWKSIGFDVRVYSFSVDKLKEKFDKLGVTFYKGFLSEGFIDLDKKVVFITDREIVGIFDTLKIRQQLIKPANIDMDDMFKEGEYVVHIDYGIGRFCGITEMEVSGRRQLYLKLEYANNEHLYVPFYQAYKLKRYVGFDSYGKLPPLDSLNTNRWKRAKQKVKAKAIELAYDLMKMYVLRKKTKGYAFPPDCDMQKEFEEMFPYEETLDQIKAIKDVKRDMESEYPMDRLICGDSGYGKTEVAMRAAFKAVLGGKQVVFMAPTTILAYQHYNTFKERMEPFGVNVKMLSRFTTSLEERETIKGLEDGSVDIVIGTHKMIYKDIKFKDLGLVIVDEEQRFGVFQKEYFRRKYSKIDVLSLSATPIPRTLNLALSGIKDMSLIVTPPPDRQEIYTYVGRWDDDKVKKAIIREISRGGKVLIVCNRISNIYDLAGRIKVMLPDIDLAVAHGRLKDEELEDIMIRFYKGDIRILVATTIVENGLDVPDVDTIIVYDAHRLGLAQMYQLRGRVGRRQKRGYAYFMYPEHATLSSSAKMRFDVISTYTWFGSGYQIALKDMEIRGIGNIFGVRQHGNIKRVGFYLYCDIIKEAIEALKGRSCVYPEIVVLTDEISIPESYVDFPELRIMIFSKLLTTTNYEELKDIESEISDRFGKIPESLQILIDLCLLRSLLGNSGICKIEVLSKKEVCFVGDNIGFWFSFFSQDFICTKKGNNKILVNFVDPTKIRQAIFKLKSHLKEGDVCAATLL